MMCVCAPPPLLPNCGGHSLHAQSVTVYKGLLWVT